MSSSAHGAALGGKSAGKMLDHLRGGGGYAKCTGYHCTDGLSDEMIEVFSNPDIKAATAEEWTKHYPVEPGTKKGARVYAAVRKKGHITYVGSTINPKDSRLDGARMHANGGGDLEHRNEDRPSMLPDVGGGSGISQEQQDSDDSHEDDKGGEESGDSYDSGEGGEE